jgi:hypothetical protein
MTMTMTRRTTVLISPSTKIDHTVSGPFYKTPETLDKRPAQVVKVEMLQDATTNRGGGGRRTGLERDTGEDDTSEPLTCTVSDNRDT